MEIAFALALVLFSSQTIAAPLRQKSKFSSIVAFGDSFTDNGNGSFRITNHTWPALPEYFGGRFSNGPVWVENVAANLSIPLYDYAIGGSTTSNKLVQGFTGPNSTVPVPGMAEQIDEFLANNNNNSIVDMSSALFVVFSGFNDIFFNTNLTAATISSAVANSVTTLLDAGAQHFLMLNYYNARQIPFDTFSDLPTKAVLQRWSSEYGSHIEDLAQGFRQQLAGDATDSSVTYVDLLPLFRHWYFYGEPTSWGYDKVGAYGSCVVGAYEETPTVTVCKDADKHVFWDEYHPERRTHRFIADLVLSKIS